ncbi:MAG: BrnT family toxin [Deltaproteobacteria bacterium]|jgi:uncharacterized protein|nr:BrnT family toxin [Deltaproteobacteria bacterium]
MEDTTHSQTEERFFCIGKTAHGVLTVRYIYRDDNHIRIFGAGYWRKGRKRYDKR